MNRRIVALALAVTLTGCVTPPQEHFVQNTQTIHRTYDAAWSGLVEYLASRNVQLKSIAKDSGVLYAEKATFDNNQADCGNPGLFIPIGRLATVNVFMKKVGDDDVQVTVNTSFSERRRLEDTIRDFRCTSRGVIEETLISAAKGT